MDRVDTLESRLGKLRELICHPGTPAGERRAALARLEALLTDRGRPAPVIRVTRSTRIGRTRRPVPLDELERLDAYALGLSYGEVVSELARACRAARFRPDRIDLGWHPEEGPVAALCVEDRPVPDLETLREAIRRWRPAAKVTLSTFVAEGERRILVFLEPGSGAGGEPEPGRATGSAP